MTVTYKGLKFGVNTGMYTEYWEQDKSYPALSMVKKNGNTYVSKKVVPDSGIPLSNKEYWCMTAPYNPQIDAYMKEAKRFYKEDYENFVNEFDKLNLAFLDINSSIELLENRVAELEKKVG